MGRDVLGADKVDVGRGHAMRGCRRTGLPVLMMRFACHFQH